MSGVRRPGYDFVTNVGAPGKPLVVLEAEVMARCASATELPHAATKDIVKNRLVILILSLTAFIVDDSLQKEFGPSAS